MARDGISQDLAERMIASQNSNDEKARLAKHVLWNDGDLTALLQAVDEMVGKLTA
jgi:dephospho-CoA kinase